MEMRPTPETVSQRLKGQFAPAYLTLTSIIQGVALAFLATRVEDTYVRFDATNWLLTIATFVVFLVVWQEYLMQALAFAWVPTLLDALVPFSFLACELFLAHFVYQDLRNWLLTLGLTCVVGAAAYMVTTMQARTLAEENRDVARVLEPHRRYRAVFVAVIVVLCLCLWALYDILHLGQVRFVIALVALIVVGGFVGSTVPHWNRVLAYTQGALKV
jgi:hypothetical protein